jgi:hypothetical protein
MECFAMTRAPDWSEAEFSLLLTHPELHAAEIAEVLPGRSADAVEIVRQGIHQFHLDRNCSMLSQTMRNALYGVADEVVCPICGKKFSS